MFLLRGAFPDYNRESKIRIDIIHGNTTMKAMAILSKNGVLAGVKLTHSLWPRGGKLGLQYAIYRIGTPGAQRCTKSYAPAFNVGVQFFELYDERLS